MSLLDDVKKNLNEWYSVTSEKTAEVARVTSRRYDKWGVSRDIERHFGELGSVIYHGLQQGRTDLLTDPDVLGLVKRIGTLEAELRAKDDEIEAIKQEYAERKGKTGPGAAGTANVLKDPALGPGSDESAILVEPEEDEHAWDVKQDT